MKNPLLTAKFQHTILTTWATISWPECFVADRIEAAELVLSRVTGNAAFNAEWESLVYAYGYPRAVQIVASAL